MAPGANPGHRSGPRALGGVHGRSRRLSAPRRPGRPGPRPGPSRAWKPLAWHRTCSDWYRLIEICALTNTLVIDEDGVYDPTQYADRLLLGFLGTMSEAELHWLRSHLPGRQAQEGLPGPTAVPAAHGADLRSRGPDRLRPRRTGPAGHPADPRPVRARSASALAVVQHFADRHLQCPARFWGGARHGQLIWRPLSHARVLDILHNPEYAGVYVYGRTRRVFSACPVRSRGSRAEHVGCGPKTGRSSSPGIIPGTSPGISSSGTDGGLRKTGFRRMRITAEPRERASPCSRGSSVVDGAGGG